MIFLFVIAAILILLLMITIHEAGHYFAGKLLGFGITEFSIGLGPKLLSRKLRSGETFSVRALPLGGYCAFESEEDEKAITEEVFPETSERSEIDSAQTSVGESKEPAAVSESNDKETTVDKKSERRTFESRKPWKRILVLLAGPMFNLVSAIIFSFIFILAAGYAVPRVTGLESNNGVPYATELKEGDVIVGVNGREITFMTSAAELFADVKNGESAVFTVERDGELKEVTVTKQYVESEDSGWRFGITTEYESRSNGFGKAALYCVPYTFELSWLILGSFGKLFTGQIPLTDMTGPVGTVELIASYSAANPMNILLFLPLIASNLAIFNLLPIPALDGARIVFVIIEWIRKKPVNRKTEGTIHAVGLMALLAFVIIVDIVGMISRI